MKIHEPVPSVCFWDNQEGRFLDDIWDRLYGGLYKTLDIEAYINNNLLPPDKLHLEKPVFDGLTHVLPGMKWCGRSCSRSLDIYTPTYRPMTLNQFIDLSADFFESLGAKRIGVHLSGGLDSGIIICLLKTLGIDFVPIGLVSSTYEFRTERRIQQILQAYGSDGMLIDIENAPFYSGLDEIPPHQMPSAAIRSNRSMDLLASAFEKSGCDVVLTGQGGDSVFVDPVDSMESLEFNIGNEFDNPEDYELFYRPRGIKLISFYGQPDIIDAICSASLGRKTDPLKIWARAWFKPILPRELSDFTYFADFFGLSMWGLEQARPAICRLFEDAYAKSKSSYFSPENIKKTMAADIFSFEYKDYIRFCSLLSIAVWYHSLFENRSLI